MSKTVKLKGNLHWRRYRNLLDDIVYEPYTVIDGKRYKLAGVCIGKFDFYEDFPYRLYIDSGRISDYRSLQSAMVKAEELLRDFKFYRYDTDKFLQVAYADGDNNYKLRHSIIGWKKAYGDSHNEVIVKVRIPRGTRCNLTTTKCRAEKAEVVGVYRTARETELNPTVLDSIGAFLVQLPDDTNIHSIYAIKTYKNVAYKSYNVGDTLEITDFDTTSDRCAPGIHFYRSVLKAIEFEF